MDEIVAWFIEVEVKAVIPGVELSTRYQWAVGHYYESFVYRVLCQFL